MYKNYISFNIFILLLFFYVSANVVVTENTKERIVFNWSLSQIDTVSFVDRGERVTSVSFKYSNFIVEEKDKRVLPAYSINVGTPFNGEIEVEFTPLEFKTVKLNYPPPRSKDNKDSIPINFYNRWLSSPLYFFVRSQKVANLIIKPVNYDEISGNLVFVTKAMGIIKFPKSNYNHPIINRNNEFERMLKNLLLNYDIAVGWRAGDRLYKRKATEPFPISFDKKVFYFRVGDGYEGFNETTTNENGLVRIDGKKIRELFGEISIKKVRLYASLKGVLPVKITENSIIPSGINEIPMLRIDKNGNGMVDNEDYFLAYVTGASDWEHDTYYGYCNFELDPYDDYRTYWLTTGIEDGLTIGIREKVGTITDKEYDRYTERIQFERSLLPTDDKGDRDFIWKVLSNVQPHFEHKLSLPGIVKEDSGLISINIAGRSEVKINFLVGGNQICTSCTFNSFYLIKEWGDLKLEIDFSDDSKSSDKRLELKGFTVNYKRRLEIGDEPTVLSILPELEDTNSVIAYNLSVNTEQKIYILSVSGEEKTILLIDSLSGKKGSTVKWIDTCIPNKRYIVCNESSIKEITQLKNPIEEGIKGRYLVRDLRAVNNKTDYLIISAKEFLAAADSLASHKRSISFNNPVVVLVDDIYRYFSGGDKDVTAIRNFIWYVASEWQGGEELNYVVLFGGGHFDAKNITTQSSDFIPVYIERNECIESFFTSILPSSLSNYKPQIAIGRIPCRNVEQAWSVVNKIVQYENIEIADFGEWRNRAVFVADDDKQANRPDNVAISRPHHVSSDIVVGIVDSLWPSMDIRKIYLYEYESDQLYQKPGASKALINEINNGVAYVNFFGHGSEVTWTDEYILTEGSITSMTNVKRYAFVSAFSCAVGRIDIPGKDCLSATLVLAKNVGAIGTLSSTREAYASSNEALASRFYNSLFENPDDPRSVGMALVDGIMSSRDNHNSYCILGDPSIKPIKPTHRLTITTNNKSDTIKALQTLVIKGNILNLDGSIDKNFNDNAYIAIGLFNPPYLTGRKDGGEDQTITYILPGKPVFLGRTNVVNGEYSQEIVIPQNVTFNSDGVKIIAYAWKEHERACGVGYKGGLIFSGSDISGTLNDTVGPMISIRPAYDNEKYSGGEVAFTDRIILQTPLSCEIELFDENGIDVVGIGPEEGINIEIEGVMPRQNFNHKFQLKKGDFRRGVVSLYLEEDAINPGSYIMNVSARDMLGNLSKKTFTVIVTSDDIIIDRVLNFPNPVRMGKETRFYCFTNFTMSQYFEVKLNFTIKIYTLSGKPVRIIRNARNGEAWDLRDQMGNILGPDVYLYQVIVEDGSKNSRRKSVKSKIMKLVILPPL